MNRAEADNVIVRANRHSLLQEVLLGSDDRSWATDPDPSDGFRRSEAEMFHQETANQSACPAQARCFWMREGQLVYHGICNILTAFRWIVQMQMVATC